MSGRASFPAGWFVAAGVVALAGIGVAASLVLGFVSAYEAPVRLLAPGTTSVEIGRPGRYIVWHEHSTVFDGRTFDLPERLPHGVQLEVKAPDGGALRSEPASMSVTWGSVKRAAIVSFEASTPGRYTVSAQGDAPPFVLAVGADFTWPLLRAIGGAIAAAVLGLGAALALALYGFVQRAPASQGAGPRVADGPEAERGRRALGEDPTRDPPGIARAPRPGPVAGAAATRARARKASFGQVKSSARGTCNPHPA